jgi:pimeloyl-ACP methyl ester carboxylesterase
VEAIRANGLEIAYRRAGNGPPLFFLHGALSDSRYWQSQVEPLSDEFTVIAWDEPGAGQSGDLHKGFELADYARCLATLIEEVGLGPGHVAGLSWGGVVALELYSRRPDLVASLVLADSYAGWKGSLPAGEVQARVDGIRRVLSAPVKDFTSGFPGMFGSAPSADATELIDRMANDARPKTVEIQVDLVAEADQRWILASVQAPTLLIWGEKDARSPLNVAKQFSDAIPGSELVVIPGAGHVSNLEQPALFNKAVRTFCRVVSSG